jgi:hypothetical protein
MKLLLTGVIAAVAVGAIFWTVKSGREPRVSAVAMVKKARLRLPAKDAPFWNSAQVAESGDFREPSAAKIFQAEVLPVNHATEVARLVKTGETKELNFALAAWFDVDASAARDWLAGQESLDSYQPALTMIVVNIACAGDPAHALEWAALLKPGPEQEQLVFDTYVIAARDHLFTKEELESAPLSEERVAELLGGAAGD